MILTKNIKMTHIVEMFIEQNIIISKCPQANLLWYDSNGALEKVDMLTRYLWND